MTQAHGVAVNFFWLQVQYTTYLWVSYGCLGALLLFRDINLNFCW